MSSNWNPNSNYDEQSSNYQDYSDSSNYGNFYMNYDAGYENSYGRSGYTWYNPQFYGQNSMDLHQQFVSQSNEPASNDVGDNSVTNTQQYEPQPGPSNIDSSNTYNQSRNSSGNPFGRTGGRRSNFSGNNRSHRNPNAYYGTTQHPHTSIRTNDKQERSTNPPKNDSKTEDRKKLLSEVATLLNQDKRHVKSAHTSRPEYDKNRDKNRGWAATQNNQHSDQDKPKINHRKNDGDKRYFHNKKREPENQRDSLIFQLTRGKLDCLVCCEKLRHHESVWSCDNCYHILHLHCISKWAVTSTSKQMDGIQLRHETTWRCPACQHQYDSIPDKYTCFCTKYTSPKFIKGETPHCCGEVCSKLRKTCQHPCTILCHPGPCPPCNATVQRSCGCGKSSQSVKCSSTLQLECELLCGKMLNCGMHDCLIKCHHGDCKPCENKTKQVCHCGSESKEVSCGSPPNYSCGIICGKSLDCGKHECTKPCHPGPCGTCPFYPQKFTTCHCGFKQMLRNSCTDPIESCGNKCIIKRAACNHECTEICHPGNCPPCLVQVTSQCRCGHSSNIQTSCHNVNILGEKPMCKKRCTKKRACAKHKCNQVCCNDVNHTCLLPCNKTLSCGKHKCEMLCHRGNCLPCTRLGFEEIRCHCGYSVIYPPTECGTRPPECNQPCSREHDCEHPPTHPCHPEPTCLPCIVLVSRTCFGGHETRKAVPCYISNYSCGLPCGKLLPCFHRCIERCHGGPCPSVCRQPCPIPRSACDHPCSLPCHISTPQCTGQLPCTKPIEISCQCQRKKQTTTCSEFRKTWLRQQTAALQAEKQEITIDPSKTNTKVLECDEECKVYERNLRLAIGLQIANPDLSNKLKPQYSKTMKDWAKKDPRFCDMVHNKLTQLVQLAKESKQKSRSYSFDIMAASRRQFVHEYCKHFGCESVAYDAEPKRNVVATAYRDKCWLPSYSLLEIVQRENGQRKLPLPPVRKEPNSDKNVLTTRDSQESAMIPLSKPSVHHPQTSQSNSWTRQNTQDRPPSPHIDYFDYTPTSS